jgi:DNA polymerase III beta subunit, N-terminal domain
MIETDIVVGAELRITCAKDELAQALGVVARALSTRSSVQILSGILLEARDGDLQLAATDMELSLRASLPVATLGQTISRRDNTRSGGRRGHRRDRGRTDAPLRARA